LSKKRLKSSHNSCSTCKVVPPNFSFMMMAMHYAMKLNVGCKLCIKVLQPFLPILGLVY
jgi:hypothetical protein